MIDLSHYDNAWDSIKTDTNQDYEELPDTTYNVFIETAKLVETKSTQKPMLKLQLRILDGMHENKCLFDNMVIHSEESLSYIKKKFNICGLNIKASEIEENLYRLLDIKLQVNKKTNFKDDKSYVNIYFNRCLNPVTQQPNNKENLAVENEPGRDKEEDVQW